MSRPQQSPTRISALAELRTLGVSLLVLAALLSLGYLVRPRIESLVSGYWGARIEAISASSKLSAPQKSDSLIVISLDLRASGQTGLSWKAIEAAHAVLPENAATLGLLGLYHVEAHRRREALRSWQEGLALDPEDNNLGYLATLDSTEVQDLDTHMLEKMFVDNAINAHLKTPIYHTPDTELFARTENQHRISWAVDTAFFGTAGLGLAVIFLAVRRIRKARRVLREADSGRAGEHQRFGFLGRAFAMSSLLKAGHVLAATYNYFTLGSNTATFVTKYVLTPTNLIDLLTSNISTVLIFIGVVAGALYVKKATRAT